MSEQPPFYHCPVLLQESVNGLITNPDGVYVDVTFGGGGHTNALLQLLSPQAKVFAFDQDGETANHACSDTRLTLIHENFRFLKRFLRLYGIQKVDGILADLGVSSHQFDTPERGFSFRFDAPLDLRMNQEQLFSAEQVVNQYSREELATLFRQYGELNHGGRIADRILAFRSQTPIRSTFDMKTAIGSLAPAGAEHKFFAQVFQALRIEVNHELDALQEMLLQTTSLLKANGRLAVISYHSLEDRIVKNFMKTGNLDGEVAKDFFGNNLSPFTLITRKPITPQSDELERNPRSRSAKLRLVARKEDDSHE